MIRRAGEIRFRLDAKDIDAIDSARGAIPGRVAKKKRQDRRPQNAGFQRCTNARGVPEPAGVFLRKTASGADLHNFRPPAHTELQKSENGGGSMTNLLLCGDLSDTSVCRALLSALARYGGFRYCGPGRLSESGPAPEYFLYESEKLPEIGLERGIILFRNSIEPQDPVFIPPGFLCVLETKNARAAALLKDTGCTAVTCGTSPQDTLSIAALEEGSAVVSLQRTLETLDGKMLEPHDFTVKCPEARSPHQLLTICAALLISGVDSAGGYLV